MQYHCWNAGGARLCLWAGRLYTGILKHFLPFRHIDTKHFNNQKFKYYLCCSSSTRSISSLAHGQSDQPAQSMLGAQSYQKPLWPTETVVTIAGNSTKPSSISSPVNSHARARDKGKGWETQHILSAGSSVPPALSTALQPYKQMPAGQSVTYFPSLHGELCHCETATEFRLHNDDKRELRRPHAVWLTLTQQLLPWHPCLLPGSLRRARLQLLQGAEVQLPRTAWQQPTRLPRSSVPPSSPSGTAWKTIPKSLLWSFLHTLSAFEDLYSAETTAACLLSSMEMTMPLH